MSRHLETVTDAEWHDLHERLVEWLTFHKVAGSALGYSLYRAIDDERVKAQAANSRYAAQVQRLLDSE